jgi:hypothetical protein
VVVIKLEYMRDRPLRFAHLWKTADEGSVFRFSGALDGFANPLASARYWCRKYRPDLEVSHSMSVDGVLQVRFTKAEGDGEPVIRRRRWADGTVTVLAAGVDRSAEQRPGSNVGCALTMASHTVEMKMADHVISVRETEVL